MYKKIMMSTIESRIESFNFGFFRWFLVLIATGIFLLQTELPMKFQANAEPVSIDAVAQFDFSDVVKAVTPAVVSVKTRKYNLDLNSSEGIFDRIQEFEIPPGLLGSPNLPEFEGTPGPELFFEAEPKIENSPFAELFDEHLDTDNVGKKPENEGRDYIKEIGSGFFISADGMVVTNEHVVRDADEIVVVTNDGAEFEAELIGTDERTDIALLKIDQPNELTYVKFSNDIPEVGEWVVAIGNPFGFGGTVTAGIVSARGRDIGTGPYSDFIQIDAPVNKGNSGGPAFNLKGEVVGVNAAIYSPIWGNVGIAFAIPSTVAEDVVADLRDEGTVVRGWLGVQVQLITEDIAESIGLNQPLGALVVSPRENSPASNAGLKSGDAIVKINNSEILSPRDLARLIASYTPGTTINLTVWRDEEEHTFTTKLGVLPDNPADNDKVSIDEENFELSKLGLGLKSAKIAGVADSGVIITNISPGSVAFKKGLRIGNVILEVSGKKVFTPNDIAEFITEARSVGRKAILIRVSNGETARFVAFPIG